MVNPRNCYQNYNVAINDSDGPIYTYLGILRAKMRNMTYCSAGQLSPLLNDPLYETIGVGTSVWLAGARGTSTPRGPSTLAGASAATTTCRWKGRARWP